MGCAAQYSKATRLCGERSLPLYSITPSARSRNDSGTARFDLGSPAPFDGIVEPDYDWSIGWQKGFYQHLDKMVCHGARRPRCSIEDTVEGAEAIVRPLWPIVITNS
jgi:hypothetical protein